VAIAPSGRVTEYPIPGGDPTGVTVAPDGAVWIAEDDANQIVRMPPPQPA
jgi:streptogramin lyase